MKEYIFLKPIIHNIKNYGYGEETIVGYEQEIKFRQKTLVTRRNNLPIILLISV
jgi:hypothetical protein